MTTSEVRMNRRFRGLLGVTVALGLFGTSCAKDPLGDLDGTPTAITTDFAILTVGVGETVGLTASVVDGRSQPLTTVVTFAACDASVTVAPDTTYDPYPKTSFRAQVTGVTAGSSCVNVSGAGLSAQVDVTIE